ncbi:hypothetical protein [Bacteroides sp. UBA939]|uniref:hypothetical protein n=1 Tax=Bacteroides sp. UBA939 TaxID=1946092 RepID=UPI0025C0D1CA|nr:hypothetical protein [Bacteroides sp. UBA939]
MKQMYDKNETNAIAKKRYSFKKGYLQVTLSQKREVRDKLMSALKISRLTYFSSLLNGGIVDISMTKYEKINAVFLEYNILDVWDISSLN